MHGYIVLIVFSMTISTSVPHPQYTPHDHPTTNNQGQHNHHYNHDHEHDHSQVRRVNPTWPSQMRTERSPHSTNSNNPKTTNAHRNLEPLFFNITLVPLPLVKNCTTRVSQDPDPGEKHWRHVGADPGSNISLDSNDSNVINLIHEIFFGNTTGNVGDDSRMIYPDDKTQQFNRKIVSRNCTFGLCEDVENYPVEEVNNLISRSKELKQYFQQMEIPSQIDFNNRFGEDGIPLCSTTSHTVFPKSAKNTKDVEMILVNVGEYKQGVVFETCANEGKKCSYSDGFPMGFTTTCKQKFTVRRLMAVAKESDDPIFDNFPLPSCCVCVVKKE